jgi:HEAT repeat protein
MNKFHGPDEASDPDYVLVAKKISDFLDEIRRGTPLSQADTWIRSECYTKKKLAIQRLVDKQLPMDQCYINLAIVEQPDEERQRSKDRAEKGSEEDGTFEPSLFLLSDRLKVDTPEKQLQIELPTLFNSHKMPDGHTKEPRRILIRGRAGVGKTTLCKRIVYDFVYAGMWNTLFDRVLWVPLRKLKELSHQELDYGKLFEYIYFEGSEDKEAFAKAFRTAIHSKTTAHRGTLFLLDGLDEVSELLDPDSRSSKFLKTLLNSSNVIITTRPHTILPGDFEKPDLELETIGFYPDQVRKYLDNVVQNPSKVEEIQSFLQKYWLLRSLVRIPIQLDAVCVTWDKGLKDNPIPETMTGVYKAIVEHLWRKDTVRLGKVPEHFAKEAHPSEIDVEMEEELLGCLALSGLYSNVIEFQPTHRDLIYKKFKERIQHRKATFPFDELLGRLSFLRTSDPSAGVSKRSYHFLHLTFQEYFAARYFVRQWEAGKDLEYLDLNGGKSMPPISPEAFFQKYKYTARYDIVWRFTTGSLEPDNVSDFFKAIEQGPFDLLGPTHQRLVMHCLSEVGSSTEIPIRSKLEARLSDWLLFECDLTNSSLLAQESECPDQALLAAIKTDSSRGKLGILKALQRPGRHLSKATTMAIVASLKNKDEDKDVRLAAAHALGQQSTLSEVVVTALIVALKNKDEDKSFRSAVAQNLGYNSTLSEAVVTALLEALKNKDEDKNVRSAAAEALGRQSALSEAALSALIANLKNKDEDKNVRSAAAEALGYQSTLSEAAIAALITALEDKDKDVRWFTAQALGYQSTLSEAAIAAFIAALEDKDRNVRSAAARALVHELTLSKAVIATLIAALENKDEYVRSAAAQALRYQLTLSEAAIAALITALEDKNKDVRWSAAQALGHQSTLSEAAIAALTAALEDKDKDVRWSAAQALGHQSTLSEAAIAALITALEDKDKDVRSAAAQALGHQSTLSEAAIAALITALEDKDKDVRWSAAQALGHQSTLSEAPIAALTAALEDKDGYVRSAAAQALGHQSTLSEAAIAALITALEDKDKDVRWSTAQALRHQSTLSEAAIAALITALEDKYRYVRSAAAEALGHQSTLSEAATAALITALEDKDGYVQSAAARALGHQSTLSEAAIAALIAALEDKDGNVRSAAARALERESTLSEAAIAALVAIVESQHQNFLSAAGGSPWSQTALLDKILEATGLLRESQKPAETKSLALCKPHRIKSLYRSLLYRSFNEHFSLYIDINASHSLCIINQLSGLRQAHCDNNQILTAISSERQRWHYDHKLWDRFEGENIQQDITLST